jgi:molecular chaperone DnaK
MVFDVIWPRGTRLPSPGEPPLTVERRYRPAHNVGHFRYLEASHVDGEGQPVGDLAVWDEVWFPFDPALAAHPDLPKVSVAHSDLAAGHEIEECYACTAAGTVAVTIRNVTVQYRREYAIGRWAPTAAPAVAPAKRRRRR